MSKIFIQIASYRDKELPITIKELLNNAKYPDNLVFGICRQYHPEDKFDNIDKYREDKRFKIIDVLYNETKGVCWARHSIQQLYDNEEYTLHLDSHHRFVENWDTKLIKMVKDLQNEGHKKPLLTAYLPSYEPLNDPEARAQDPWQMCFDRFIPEGAIFFKPEGVPDWRNRELAVPGRFFSAHFCFTLGKFCIEVPHNPDYLFHGEEISIAARAFTWGYDIFYPHRLIAWHEYSRSYRPQAWGDDPKWEEKNKASHLINRKLFGMDGLEQEGHDGLYGFGPIRTLREYEKHVGILFHKRAIQQYTIDNKFPPNPTFNNEEEWLDSFASIFKHCIDLHSSHFPEDDYEFWVVSFEKDDGTVINRKDASPNEIKTLIEKSKSDNGWIRLWRDFIGDKPDFWVVWAYSKSKGWGERLSRRL